jgi:hypothetical protein
MEGEGINVSDFILCPIMTNGGGNAPQGTTVFIRVGGVTDINIIVMTQG